jgi:hypothetical protein
MKFHGVSSGVYLLGWRGSVRIAPFAGRCFVASLRILPDLAVLKNHIARFWNHYQKKLPEFINRKYHEASQIRRAG